MPTIDQLSQAKTLSITDELALYSSEIGTTIKGTLEQVAAVVQEAIEGTPDETVYSLNAGTVTVLPTTSGGSAWAQITLSGPAAALTVILPGVDDRAHGQEVLVTVTQAVTALTINGSGAMTVGAPSALIAGGFFRLRFDSVSNTWYRVG